MTIRPVRRSPRLWKVALASLVVMCLLAAVVLAYVRVGWWRMEAACMSDVPGRVGDTSPVAFAWEWTPPGFTCTFADGRTETSLWF